MSRQFCKFSRLFFLSNYAKSAQNKLCRPKDNTIGLGYIEIRFCWDILLSVFTRPINNRIGYRIGYIIFNIFFLPFCQRHSTNAIPPTQLRQRRRLKILLKYNFSPTVAARNNICNFAMPINNASPLLWLSCGSE